MNNYVWSAKNGRFFAILLRESYDKAGWDLSDAIDVDNSIYMEFNGNPPTGKICGVVDGMPGWIDSPGLTEEDLIGFNRARQLELRAAADSEINWRQDAVDDGDATDEEKADLSRWRKYRTQLMRIDIASGGSVKWPVAPK